MKKKHFIISITILLACLYYLLHNIDIPKVWDALKSIRFSYLIPAILIVTVTFITRAVRWRYLISSIKVVRTTDLFAPLIVGFMGTIVAGRAGEAIRAYLLGKREGINVSAALATLLVERLLDLLIVILLLFWVLLFNADVFTGPNINSPQLKGYMVTFGWISMSGFIFILTFITLLLYRTDLALKTVSFFTYPLPEKWKEPIIGMVHSFTEGLHIVKDLRSFLTAFLLSAFVWGTILLMHYPLCMAFGITDKLPLFNAIVMLTLSGAIFIALDPSPAFFASFHFASVAALHELFGIQKEVALSYGIVNWSVSMGFIFVLGTFFVLKDQISFKELKEKNEEIE